MSLDFPLACRDVAGGMLAVSIETLATVGLTGKLRDPMYPISSHSTPKRLESIGSVSQVRAGAKENAAAPGACQHLGLVSRS